MKQQIDSSGGLKENHMRAVGKCDRKCFQCTLEMCIEDSQKIVNLPPNKRDRTEYDKKYYQENKSARKAYFRVRRLQRIYPEINNCLVNYIEVYHAVNKIKKLIGEDNYNLVIEAIEKVEENV